MTHVAGPNSATSIYGYDSAGRRSSTQGADGEYSTTFHYVPSRTGETKTGKRFSKSTFDGLGRVTKVESGYYNASNVAVVETVVDTEYAPCACTPMGKMKRVSQPHAPGATAVWTVYEYDELGRTTKVTYPPNTGTVGNSGFTTYEYLWNTVKVTDPAGRWKKYTMDGFGNLTSVEEPKPGGGSYVTNYTYTKFGELATVSMTRDGYSGHTAQQVTQTRTFEYDGTGEGRLTKTIFPENGVTEYGYNSTTKLLEWKKNSRGIWKYFYTSARLQRVEKYPGATNVNSPGPEANSGRVTYYYDSQTLNPQFVGEYTAGRVAAIQYNAEMYAEGGPAREYFSYTRGGKLKMKRLEVLGYSNRCDV